MAKKKNKDKIMYFCKECGYESPKWLGKCPACNSWNSMAEIKIEDSNIRTVPNTKQDNKAVNEEAKAVPLKEIESKSEVRVNTNIDEFDRVMGGGIVPGSITLLGGDPGIGKSTILMQVANELAKSLKVLYISGEESTHQIKLRCDRINVNSENIFILAETRMQKIVNEIDRLNPDVIVVDSIQTMYKEDATGLPGNVTQLRESTMDYLNIAKENNICVFLIGHVTKEGQIAGPRVLEHIVDTVLYFEGDSNNSLKLLRSVKNRFGASNEVGIFKMEEQGMQAVSNPSIVMLGEYKFDLVGTSVTSIYEGSIPILVELQALVIQTYYTMPRRTVEGVDFNKLLRIIAVLEKRLGLVLGNKDIYINVIGGIKINDPSVDLSLSASIYSSLKNITFPKKTAFIGEVGLSGEIRGVKNIAGRVTECFKFGIEQVVVPKKNYDDVEKYAGKLKIIGADNVKEAIERSFG